MGYCQISIQMKKEGGVYLIPCKVNGLNLNFIFDTGASDVSISLSEAVFMIKNGYIKESDLVGIEYYQIANGDISEGTKLIIRQLEIGNKTLYNVEASIVHSLSAPLLLGNSAISKFGKYSIDYSTNTLTLGSVNTINTTYSQNTNENNFKTVKIGIQTWMTENLNVSTFRNGDVIPEAKTDEEWNKAGNEGKPAWCYYDNDSENGKRYGKLYNWYAVNDPRGLAPKGWHVPTDAEWTTLTDYLGGEAVAGTKMKSDSGWNDFDGKTGNGTNACGFEGLPGGGRNSSGVFYYIGLYGAWWSSSEGGADRAWDRSLTFNNGDVYRYPGSLKVVGCWVRCNKD